jgi:hypothetical protein
MWSRMNDLRINWETFRLYLRDFNFQQIRCGFLNATVTTVVVAVVAIVNLEKGVLVGLVNKRMSAFGCRFLSATLLTLGTSGFFRPGTRPLIITMDVRKDCGERNQELIIHL